MKNDQLVKFAVIWKGILEKKKTILDLITKCDEDQYRALMLSLSYLKNIGICPICSATGKVGEICENKCGGYILKEIYSCEKCRAVGQAGQLCKNGCGIYKVEKTGICPSCNSLGRAGFPCKDNCGQYEKSAFYYKLRKFPEVGEYFSLKLNKSFGEKINIERTSDKYVLVNTWNDSFLGSFRTAEVMKNTYFTKAEREGLALKIAAIYKNADDRKLKPRHFTKLRSGVGNLLDADRKPTAAQIRKLKAEERREKEKDFIFEFKDLL